MESTARFEEWDNEQGALLIGGWAREGLKLEEIAQNIGIHDSTLRKWRKKSNLIRTALKNNKAAADFKVEDALLKKALGYTIVIKHPDGREEEKYYPPDTMAQIYWLNNRKPALWKNKQREQAASKPEEAQAFINALNKAGGEAFR